jgi:hypothetical protein
LALFNSTTYSNDFVLLASKTLKASALKMAAICFSEKLLFTREFTRLNNPEDQHQHLFFSQNLKPQCSQDLNGTSGMMPSQ